METYSKVMFVKKRTSKASDMDMGGLSARTYLTSLPMSMMETGPTIGAMAADAATTTTGSSTRGTGVRAGAKETASYSWLIAKGTTVNGNATSAKARASSGAALTTPGTRVSSKLD